MKMEQTKCSETLSFKLQTPVNHPEQSTQHSEHGESLKSGMNKELEIEVLLHGGYNIHIQSVEEQEGSNVVKFSKLKTCGKLGFS
jgi:hypothetical protein